MTGFAKGYRQMSEKNAWPLQVRPTMVMVYAVALFMVVSTFFAIATIRDVGHRSSEEQLVNLAVSGAKSLDSYFNGVEQSVEMVAAYAEADLSGGNVEDHLKRVGRVFGEVTYRTNGVLTYYYRIDPSVQELGDGFWYTNLHGNGFKRHEVTDISAYDTDDTTQLVWYTVPKATGEAVWLAPYITDNLDVRVISYNVPIYWKNRFIGVIGIEIDYSTMSEQVNSISLYKHGYAFLCDEKGNLIYHPSVDVTAMDDPPHMEADSGEELTNFTYVYEGVQKQAVWTKLANDMRLYVSVPSEEIDADWTHSVMMIAIASLILLIIVGVLSAHLVRLLREDEATKEEQRRLEQELRSVTELTEMLGSVSSFFSNMPAMSFTKDVETGAYIACNQAFAEYAGKKDPSEVIGLTDYDLFDPITAAHFQADDERAVWMKDAYVFVEDVPDAYQSVVRNLQTTKKKYTDTNGRMCLLGMCVDVTASTRAKMDETARQVRAEEAQERQALERSYQKDVERLSYQASHDELTGLLNRFGYDFILMELDIQSAYLLMVDADDFKSINDSYGHLIGDQVLCKIANTLLKNFRANDYVCRIGGDEFVVIMIGATTKLKPLIRSKIEKINDELCDTSDGVPPISVSVGVTHGSEAADAADLLKIADRAMYELKQHGKHGYYFSDELSGLRHSSTPES